MGGSSALSRALVALVAATAACAVPARAQDRCTGPYPVPVESQPAPLDRIVTFHARDVSLRSALDRLAAAARVRLSYSSELLPIDRAICLSSESITLGTALRELLRGVGVVPVVAGPDRVVLAPTSGSRDPLSGTPATVLERVVVTGSATSAPQRGLPVALDVLSGRRLTGRASEPLAQLLDAGVAGIWVWEPSPAVLQARYGSIRGASSFEMSYPKVFLDGIELANPLLLTRLASDIVERVEVVRGPASAALYGIDAISGVINVVTRHDGLTGGGRPFQMRSSVGVAESVFSPDDALSQEHSVTVRLGAGPHTLNLNATAGGLGTLLRRAPSRHLIVNLGGRAVGERTISTFTARAHAEGAAFETSLLDALDPGSVPAPISPRRQSTQEYTAGVTSTFLQSDRWTHSAVLGLDANVLRGIPDEPTPSQAGMGTGQEENIDSDAARAMFRWSSLARFGSDDAAATTLTLSTEQSILRERSSDPDELGAPATRPGDGGGVEYVEWQHGTGVLALANVAVRRRLYLTGGVREERNDGFAGGDRYTTLPTLGASYLAERGGVTLKLRAAYGSGMRSPRTAAREASWSGAHALSGDLRPERQSGAEAGMDLLLGRRLSLHITRYDQLASGLIQRVAVAVPDSVGESEGMGSDRKLGFVLENVGEITNRGWEIRGDLGEGPLSITATLARSDSRVARLADGYTGDLRPGDRMLEVPASSAGLSASWHDRGWTATGAAYRAWNWIGYDRIALASAYRDDQRPSEELVGGPLRRYWREYDGRPHVRTTLARELRPDLSVVLSADNLLNGRDGEPDNATRLPGRCLSIGIAAAL